MELPEDGASCASSTPTRDSIRESPEASEYIRELQTVQMTAGGVMECWFYRYNWKPDASRAIESGVWRRVERSAARILMRSVT